MKTRLLTVLLLSVHLHAQNPGDRLLQRTGVNGFMDSIVRSYASVNCFSGSVLVAKGGKVFFEKSYGLANREEMTPVEKETRFFVASVSKSFTAAAILLLQERGLLKLSDPVSKYIHGYVHGDSVTIYHLLLHTSGIPDIVLYDNYSDLSKRHYTVKDILPLFISKPLQFAPGKSERYSNSNYILLAYLVEQVSGDSYASFIKKNIFTPLNMNASGAFESWKDIVRHRAHGYALSGLQDFLNAEYYDYSVDAGAGSIYSNPEDLFQWTQGLFHGKILNAASMHTLLSIDDDGAHSIAWSPDTVNGKKCYHAVGWDGVGFSSNITYFPEDDLCIIVLGNLNIISIANQVVSRIAQLLYKNEYNPFVVYRHAYTAQQIKEFAGDYTLGQDFYVPGLILHIVVKDGALYELQGSGVLMGLIPTGENEFMHRSSFGTIQFLKDVNGNITGMRFYNKFNAIKS